MHRGLRREFQESIIEDREPLMSGEEGRKDVAVAQGADKSVERGEVLQLTPP